MYFAEAKWLCDSRMREKHVVTRWQYAVWSPPQRVAVGARAVPSQSGAASLMKQHIARIIAVAVTFHNRLRKGGRNLEEIFGGGIQSPLLFCLHAFSASSVLFAHSYFPYLQVFEVAGAVRCQGGAKGVSKTQ